MKILLLFPILCIIIFPISGKYLFNFIESRSRQNFTINQYTGSNIKLFPTSYLQVETSAYTHPADNNIIIASAITNYFTGGYTSGFFISTNRGLNWTGSGDIKNSAGNTIVTIGDPEILINNNGSFLMTYIAPSPTGGSDLKAGASLSTNNGLTWSSTIYIPGVDSADKPVSETDNNSSSPYLGRTYLAYDELKNGGEEIKGIYFSYSTNGGITWDSSRRITNTNPLYKFRLISDISAGSSGDVCVLWYTSRKYLGFSKSTNGGVNWIINKDTAIVTDSTTITYEYGDVYLTGIPSIETDNSGGIRNGWIYTVGVEKNTDKLDLILHRSTDGGVTWNYKKKVNQDSSGGLTIQSMPSMDADRYGGINIFYYDARNSTANDSFEVWLSRSVDGGNSFFDTKISDHKFKLTRPVETLFYIEGYIGSYTGVTSGTDKLTPVWYDNSSGVYLAYTSNIELLPDFEIKVFPEGFYDATNQKLRMKDTAKVYLRGPVSPYSIIDSAKGVMDSVTFNVSLKYRSDLPPGNYYLGVRHRNSIETWSALPVNYSFGTTVNYDFTELSSSAFGNNLNSVDSKWGIYSGDIDQNGFIDLTDVISIYNKSNIFTSGYIKQDCNGDSIVDLSDIIIAYNNAVLFVARIIP